MLKQIDVLNEIASEDYQISLPLLAKGADTQFSIQSTLRLLATLIRYGMIKTIHVSERETIVVITSGNSRIGFVWKLMPNGILLLRDIQNMDEFKVAMATAKIIPFSAVRKGVAA